MGNHCGDICLEGTDIKLGVVSSQNFDKLIHSKFVENDQFPENLIPETVKEKTKLLKIEPDFEKSELWKYEDSQIKSQNTFDVAYAVISKQNVQPKPLNQQKGSNESEQDIVAVKKINTSQNKQQNANQHEIENNQSKEGSHLKKLNLNQDRFQNATIFLFKAQPIVSKNGSNQNQTQQNKNLKLKKVYHGPINPLMRAPDAIIILENGEYYKGNVYQFNFQGKGVMKNALGNHVYDGAWQNNKPHGLGSQQLTDQFKYQGDFANGKWNGKGKLTLFNSIDRYQIDGTFLEGNIEGPGKITDKNGSIVYDGLFKNGKQHGKGTWIGKNGQSYQGEFIEGKKQGFGKYVFKSGKRFEGYFKDGIPSGEGYLIEDDNKIEGFWYKGENILTKKVIQI